MSNQSALVNRLASVHLRGGWDAVAAEVERMSAWQRYIPGDVLAFDVPVAAVDPQGRGRVTRSHWLNARDRYCLLPPIPPWVDDDEPPEVTNG